MKRIITVFVMLLLAAFVFAEDLEPSGDIAMVIVKLDKGNLGGDQFLTKGTATLDYGTGKLYTAQISSVAVYVAGMNTKGYTLISQSTFVTSGNGTSVYMSLIFQKAAKK